MIALDDAVKEVWFPDAPAQPRGWRGTALPLARGVLDLVFPLHCGACNRPLDSTANNALCRPCAAEIRWIGVDRCSRCGAAVGQGRGVVSSCPACVAHPPAHIAAACALASYSAGPLRDLILGIKFGSKLHFVPPLAELLGRRIQATGVLRGEMIIVPAPLTRPALFQRGFNQARELAAQVAKRLKLPVEPRLIRKIRNTRPQATLSHPQRRENLKDAFVCDARIAARYQNVNILLIDDVITTGSTVSECARTLTAAGTGTICAAALARG